MKVSFDLLSPSRQDDTFDFITSPVLSLKLALELFKPLTLSFRNVLEAEFEKCAHTIKLVLSYFKFDEGYE